MTRVSGLHKRWMRDSQYRDSYAELQQEFALARAVIEARKRAGLTQLQLAKKMGTTQPVVARLEAGNARPSLRTLERLAQATGSDLVISFHARKRPAKADARPGSSFEVSSTPTRRARKTG